MMRRFYYVVGLLLVLMAGIVIQAQDDAPVVARLVPEVINVYPHDPMAFTQGLLIHDGVFYESTGSRPVPTLSTLRRVDIEQGEVLQRLELDEAYFGEGLERVGDRLIQLTWTSGEAFVYDIETFERLETYTYEGEGWGLCYDGRYLFMSDSTNYLQVRDAETFDLVVKFLVTLDGNPIQESLLNELECVGDYIYANLWLTDFIVQIDKFSGQITAVIDASGLLTGEEREALDANAVLNGIAYDDENETFFITGKLWDKMFEVRFVEAEE